MRSAIDPLTPDELAAFRAMVANPPRPRASKTGTPAPPTMMDVLLVSGPLDGVRTQLPIGSQRPGARIGWCHVTDAGLTMAEYVPGEDEREWRFHGWQFPGMRQSGLESR